MLPVRPRSRKRTAFSNVFRMPATWRCTETTRLRTVRWTTYEGRTSPHYYGSKRVRSQPNPFALGVSSGNLRRGTKKRPRWKQS
eukprot:401569-Pyramimonas_sp.AAC.1